MKKFLVKYFALGYITKIFGKQITFVRAANIITPLIFLTGYKLGFDSSYPEVKIDDIVVLSLFILSILISFVYFRIEPVKWEELDDVQKFQFGEHVKSGNVTAELTEEQQEEHRDISEELQDRLSETKFYNVLTLLINPISTIIFLSFVL